MSNFGRDALWDTATWSELDQAVSEELERVRVARKVFRTEDLGASGAPPPWVSVAEIQRALPIARFIPEDGARPFVEISVPFWLTPAQAEAEDTLHTARKLARACARLLALAEDHVILRGERMPSGWQVRARNMSGLRGLAAVTVAAHMLQLDPKSPVDVHRQPISLVDKANQGMTGLTANGWAGPYALILGQDVYSIAYSRLYKDSGKTAADQLAPQLRHCLLSGAMEADKGILISLAGDAVTVYTAGEASVSFSGEELRPQGAFYRFSVVQRVQYAVTDRSCIRLIHL